MIEFLCPNGHKIRCPDEQAGQVAKCPKCGVRFRIPEMDELGGAESTENGGQADSPAKGQIEFLCPNGHQLNGPADLQGKPGECPECGARFRIPVYEDLSEENIQEEEINVGHVGVSDVDDDEIDESMIAQPPTHPRPKTQPTPNRFVSDGSRVTGGSGIPVVEGSGVPIAMDGSGMVPLMHPMAALFSRLWAEKNNGGDIELEVEGGESVIPDHFARPLSRENYAVFGIKSPDGTYTLMAIKWDSVTRVLVRGIKELPVEMAD